MSRNVEAEDRTSDTRTNGGRRDRRRDVHIPVGELREIRAGPVEAGADQVLAGGVSSAFCISENLVPLVIRKAEGALVVDENGYEYIDFVCGFGPVILGHSHPAVCSAAAAA